MLLSQSALEECTDESDAAVDASTVSDSSPSSYDAVVVGLAPTLLDYAHLNTAFRILIGEDRPRDLASQSLPNTKSTSYTETEPPRRPPLIALHKVRYLEASDHALSLGPGPFVLALEDAARTSATVVGKPTRAFFETVLRDLDRDLGDSAQHAGVDSQKRWEGIAVIGDDVQADLGEGAIELGLWRVLGALHFTVPCLYVTFITGGQCKRASIAQGMKAGRMHCHLTRSARRFLGSWMHFLSNERHHDCLNRVRNVKVIVIVV